MLPHDAKNVANAKRTGWAPVTTSNDGTCFAMEVVRAAPLKKLADGRYARK
ncbi:MAG: hypothetical protein ABGY24_04525 [bacterium]